MQFCDHNIKAQIFLIIIWKFIVMIKTIFKV